MARSLGSVLPEVLLTRFSPDTTPPPGRVVVIVTVDAAGLPHPALLADAEVLALHPRALRLAVQPNSRTAANLREPGVASLALVEPEGVHYVKLRVRDAFSGGSRPAEPDARALGGSVANGRSSAPAPPPGSGFACFEAEVIDVLADEPHSGEMGAFLQAGLRFAVENQAAYAERAAAARRALARQE
ncbi:MAG: hypothetical protein NDJ94_08490 [Vicinamibacteria bacterium]|jgi:hypothetical protein|nr:hypothetical protein [Vicinamibacteria bacterium]